MFIGICQTDIIQCDKERNILVAEDYIARCSAKGAKLVLFPEMSFTGYEKNPGEIAEDYHGGILLDRVSTYARKYNTYIGFGFAGEKNGSYYNRYEIVSPEGKIICEYNKIHPFSYDGEDVFYTSGDSISFCEIDGITICPLICYDLRFPELFQSASKSADLILVPANWGGARNEQWKLLIRARAVENQCYVAGINRVGVTNDNFYVGNSAIVDPKGTVCEALKDAEDFAVAYIDKTLVKEFREEFPVKRDRRPDLYYKLGI
ncbi:MAG: carbon-nitrogen family hydrolase [Butyrivibrio sp.]|nr:carbon-nitrogen family hydrolase [Butyrivibrio sp.]